MRIKQLLENKKISIYKLSKKSGVPYATLNDICNDKTSLEKCSAETVYKLSKALEVSMEELVSPYMEKRPRFENFKSYVCHMVKEKGEIDFIIETLESGDVRSYFDKNWYIESMYLLGMLDYVSRKNNVPLCEEYNDIRRCKLEKPVYPSGVTAVSEAIQKEEILKEAFDNAIPEFKRFNIIENEVLNVI